MKNFFPKLMLSLITFLLILGGALTLLLNTQQGLRFSFAVVSKIIPGKLSAQKVNGCLLGPIDIEKLDFKNKTTHINADKIHLEWDIKNVLDGITSITKLHANKIKINIKTIKDDQKKSSLDDITENLKSLNLAMYLVSKDIQLQDISWQQNTDAPIKINSISLQSHMTGENIETLKGELRSQDATISIQGSIKKEWDISWKLLLPKIEKFSQEINGSLECIGKIAGERNTPIINTSINITNFKHDNASFTKLQGKADIDLSTKKKSSFELKISSPKISSVSFNQLAFSGNISPKKLKEQNAELNIDIGSTTMFFPIGTSSQLIKLKKGNIKGLLNQRGLFTKGSLLLSQHNPVNIELNFPELKNLSSLSNNQPINGKLIWQTQNLSFLQPTLPNIKNLQGTLDIQYAAAGTLQNPKISGTAKLSNVGFKIPELNITLQNTELNVKSSHDKTTYQATIHSGGGVLNLSGETIFYKNKIDSKILITGTNFLLANTDEYHVIASPQLTLQTKNDLLELTGKIFVPKATIKPQHFGRAGLLPSEIVYVNKGKVEKPQGLDIYTQIEIDLGKDVSLEVMGLKGKLLGKLQIIDDPKKIITALGTIYIKEGSYDIYGQQLEITKGSLNFFGETITNPKIDIEAIRSFKTSSAIIRMGSSNEGLIVGVKMTGVLDNAKIDLFSTPSGLSKTDIISYLILGQPSNKASENKTLLLLQAASALNFRGAGKVDSLFGDLKEDLGLSEFGLTEEVRTNTPKEITPPQQKPGDSLTTSTAFSLGKYITPKIHIGYSVGFLDLVNIFRVRYHMGRHWSIQSESSTLGNGVDLLYSIEHD